MGRNDKLIERFKRQPVDFTSDELERLLAVFGYVRSNKGKTSGPRDVFSNGASRPIMLHKPHPGNVMKSYAMKQVLDYLTEAGLIK